MRGVWVDAFGEGIRSPGEVAALVDVAVTAGLDTLVVQVTRRGDALAGALPLPRADADLAPPPFDPLAAVCERAHGAGLAVHAWLAATPIGQDGTAPVDPAEWLSRHVDGTERDRHGIAHLDPGHPDARAFVAECAATLAECYPVDGVNLDRVRYPDSVHHDAADWGYNPVALERYRAHAGTGAPPDPHDLGWQAWRREQVTALVAETAARVHAVRDGVVVSSTGVCFGGLERGWAASRAWVECGQDWPGWLRARTVDRVLVMNYRGDADDADLVARAPAGADLQAEGAVAELVDPGVLRARFDDWARLAIDAGDGHAVLGTGLYLQGVEDHAALVRHALTLTVDGQRGGGWCGFSYRTPSRAVLRGQRTAAHEWVTLARELRGIAA